MAPTDTAEREVVGPLDAAGLSADGSYLVGTYLGLRDGEPREVRGKTYLNCDAGIRIAGGVIETVNFSDRRSAQDAVAGLSVGDRCALRTEIKFGYSNGRPWMFHAGPRSGPESSSGFADEFSG
jgi:hypothetical protein